jgi:hypothetical protein
LLQSSSSRADVGVEVAEEEVPETVNPLLEEVNSEIEWTLKKAQAAKAAAKAAAIAVCLIAFQTNLFDSSD